MCTLTVVFMCTYQTATRRGTVPETAGIFLVRLSLCLNNAVFKAPRKSMSLIEKVEILSKTEVHQKLIMTGVVSWPDGVGVDPSSPAVTLTIHTLSIFCTQNETRICVLFVVLIKFKSSVRCRGKFQKFCKHHVGLVDRHFIRFIVQFFL